MLPSLTLTGTVFSAVTRPSVSGASAAVGASPCADSSGPPQPATSPSNSIHPAPCFIIAVLLSCFRFGGPC